MGEIATIAKSGELAPAANTDKWRGFISADGAVEVYETLPSPAETAAMLAEVKSALAPITTTQLRPAIKDLVTAYPQRGPDDATGYAKALLENLAGYPPDVVRQTCRQLVRTCKFLPTVCEAVEVADGLLARRRNALWRLQQVEAVRAEQEEIRERQREVNRFRVAMNLAATMHGWEDEKGNPARSTSARNNMAQIIVASIELDEEPDLQTVLARLGMTEAQVAEAAWAKHYGRPVGVAA